ncbi:MAG: PadR family transcriptional regulator [Chloroflexi bacterium]|nr:PadR family transcriptional regulator [Chloroflexota bacterium]
MLTDCRAPLAGAASRWRIRPAAGRDHSLEWAAELAIDVPRRDERMVKAFWFGLLPAHKGIEQLRVVRASNAEQPAEEICRRLDAARDSGHLSDSGHLGMLLRPRRGIVCEASYVAWCDEAIGLIKARSATVVQS